MLKYLSGAFCPFKQIFAIVRLLVVFRVQLDSSVLLPVLSRSSGVGSDPEGPKSRLCLGVYIEMDE